MELVPNQDNAINLFITTDGKHNNQYKNNGMFCLEKIRSKSSVSGLGQN